MINKAVLAFSDAAAIPVYAPNSKAVEGFYNTFLGNLKTDVADIFSKFLDNLFGLSAAFVLSLSIIDFHLLRWTRSPIFIFELVKVDHFRKIQYYYSGAHQHNIKSLWIFDETKTEKVEKVMLLFFTAFVICKKN